ncbi:hypothetical protein EW146_g2846 [Bondarzewia mesenterica]|uniref:Uncharacterized protein n=1 Tax=Bondarzewia mesenterica TaxID=1095465 RepID=A0A4S4LZJ3_9AGAM|nr:hypothetical protein EW146_g2846 [Bondarzewia mesenterica]
MLRSMNSPHSPTDDHLRRLLDQRAARADIHHGRFPSLTDFSDSPSVYSHPYFSPQPLDKAELAANTDGFDFAIPSQYRNLVHEPRTPGLDRERLNDPSASILDLEDDPTDSRPNSQLYEDDHSPSYDDNDDSEPVPRMSMLGPKMRFHSPAPWEMEEEPIEEQDEQDDDARSFISRRGRIRTKGEGFIKGLGLGSSAARGNSATRPSVDSSRSNEKKSFETTSSYVPPLHGALHALAQASMSSTSLAIVPPSSGQSSLRNKLIPRPRTRTASNSGKHLQLTATSSPRSNIFSTLSENASPVARVSSTTQSLFSNHLSRSDTLTSSRPDSPQSFTRHPYANPELAYNRDSVYMPTPMHTNSRDIPTSDSAATLPDTNTTRSSSPFASSSVVTVTMTPDSSSSSVVNNGSDMSSSKRFAGNLHGHSISSPMFVDAAALRVATSSTSIKSKKRETRIPQPMNQLPGWAELPASPTFTLISLEEAQAQARERARSVTANAPVNKAPFLETEPPSRYSPGAPPVGGSARARSVSAGSRAKMALQSFTTGSSPSAFPRSEQPDANPPPNSGAPPRLKHKKSGFMRLFNGKDKEKEKEKEREKGSPPPPPLPFLPDITVPPLPVPKTPKTTSARVPVPTLSPSLVSQTGGSYFDHVAPKGATDDSKTDNTDESQQRPATIWRNLPPLSIATPSERAQHQPTTPLSTKADNRSRSTLRPNPNDAAPVPFSAPPATSAFPSLSLRPVSTIFSAHFTEHLVDGESPVDQEPELDTSRRLSVSVPFLGQQDDASAIIQALQEQISTSRKAWQRQIWELEGHVRDLRAEVEELRAKEAEGEPCNVCGRGVVRQGEVFVSSADIAPESRPSIVNRPRARTGVGTRFGTRA